MLGITAALVAALAAAPYAHASHLIFKPDGRVLATDDITEWDVTGFATNEPNRSIADPDIRYCMICDPHRVTEACAAALQAHFDDVCGSGVTSAAQAEAAQRMGLLGPPQHWCDMQCKFEATDHVEHTGNGNDLHACMHGALDSCHRLVQEDHHYRLRLEQGKVHRAEVMMPHWLHTLHHEERPHLEPTEGEPHEEFIARAMDFDLAYAVDNRQVGQLPPAPPACTTCRQHGIASHQCAQAARSMAKSLCIDGDELPLCAMGHMHCFPFPEQLAEVHERELANMAEDRKRIGADPAPHELRTWVTDSLGDECGMALLDVCIRGVIIPGSSIKTISQRAQPHHSHHRHDADHRDHTPPHLQPRHGSQRDEL